ncbi:TetR/AcrR family transcriptional regulator [Cellulosimicrobium protaetiae]|uniref:TetR/AcrR family transcriptional regulator n=1 Tax=Cellulosimicrobium protaetiae TaxID=2587808 RepID=A0A6M5UGL5_9MICO|nr:TetR/AcrR family transcriptional regulator [Cellulosimicrobium protaetiae]QJW36752.1 TetR/AcrR family transcriptional regulator [Cellulosimicrobium protaetiae]
MTSENGHDARRRRTHEAILASAARLFEAQGFAGTTVAEVARAADVSERTFYLHFPTKEDLLFDHVHGFTELAWRVAEESRTPSAAARVDAALRALVDAATADAALVAQARARSALGESGRAPASLAVRLATLVAGLADRVARGTRIPLRDVAPMVGAGVGAVEAAGLALARETDDPVVLRRGMLAALDAALVGFRA